MSLHIVILAAGQGTRMRSTLPKVLHSVGGKPMLERVIQTASSLNPENIHIIIGHEGEKVKHDLAAYEVNWIHQEKQLGTGHAVLQALPHIPSNAKLLILYADVPLIEQQTLLSLIEDTAFGSINLLVALVKEPAGLGRIIRSREGDISHIVEEKDADYHQRQINEIYSGICCGFANDFQRWLPQLQPNNAQGEYYLTEMITFAAKENFKINSLCVKDPIEIQGVNNRVQLNLVERAFQMKQAHALMLNGTTLADASRIDIRGNLTCGQDVFIDINTVFSGEVKLGHQCVIGAGAILHNVELGNHCEVFPFTILNDCRIEDNVHVGPFARIRPGTVLGKGCKIGNFVEMKNAQFGINSKASHLSYIGDATIGDDVNIGAGTITCNYDGANKHQTIIEDGVFIGSDTQLVAPVTIGKNATIGAGSTIRKNVPAEELTLTESKQKTINGWKRPTKKANK